jgi:hypothetical protein
VKFELDPRQGPAWARSWPGALLAILLAGLASIALRQDSNWDLQNYHLYNAWAFVHDRYGIDWSPAGLQTFYSPFLDLPFYALLAADAPPRLIAFALAIPTGIAWFFFARIVVALFAEAPDGVRRPAIVTAIGIGVTAPMPISLIGLTMNDWYVAAFVMAALWLVVRDFTTTGAARTRTLIIAGALVGTGAGLKLTGTVYCVGLIGGLLATGGAWRSRACAALITGGAVTVAFAVTAGPWMWLMYERYGNPMFPYFNNVFRSPWADPIAYASNFFGPGSAGEWLVFPFVLLWKLQHYVAEAEFRDARPALLYSLALISLAMALRHRTRTVTTNAAALPSEAASGPPPSGASATRRRQPNAWRFIGAFFVASFVAWAILYRIFRYLVPLELLAGALIVLLLIRIVPRKRVPIALAAAVLLVIVTAKFPTWWRQKFEDHFLTVQMPAVKPGALVLLVAAEPLAYVLPSFPADARFAGLANGFNDPARVNLLQQTITAVIRDHRGPLYALAVPPGRDEGGAALAKMGLTRTTCQPIRTNLRVSPLELCELRRT